MIRPIFISGILTLATFAELPTKGVDLKLISSVRTISPSSTFTVGLKIHHHPGFHTYWKNPGAVGYPITINWDLPPGFSAGPIRWPVPEISDMADNPVFGYESDVTLLVDLTAPEKLPENSYDLKATVSWMACSEACHPGNKTFSLTLASDTETKIDPAKHELFTFAESRVPKPLKNWSAEVLSASTSENILITVSTSSHPPDPSQLRFFSSDGQISSSPDPEITKIEDNKYRIRANRATFGPIDAKSLPFVLVIEAASGERTVFGTLDPAYPGRPIDENAQTP